jgi:hypothetical protein
VFDYRDRKRQVVSLVVVVVVVVEPADGKAGSPKSHATSKEVAQADPLDRGRGNPARELQSADFIA